MIFNKKLNISDSDVLDENDISKLSKWRDDLTIQIISLNQKIENIDGEIPVSLTTAKKYLITLSNMVIYRIKEVRKSESLDVLVMRKFMKVAKARMTKTEYKEILEEAKKLAKYRK